MNAIILAAGSGKRLAPAGWDKPKCLLEFGSATLLERIGEAAAACGCERAVVVVGYRRGLIEERLANMPLPCATVANEAYDETNTIHSLWLAREFLSGEVLYFNADVLFDHRTVGLLGAKGGSALAVQEKRCGAEEVKVAVDEALRVRRIGKALLPEDCFGEFIGVARFGASLGPDLIASLEHHNERRKQRDLFFEAAVDAILDRHAVAAVPLGDLAAIEIDTPEDLEAARSLWSSGRIR